MSWEEKIKNRIKITTGDGQFYEPLMKAESFTGSFEFNVTEFEFPEIIGTKVDKRLRKGVRYPMDLYFQGETCIEQGKQFIESTNDKRPWKVIHPIFGTFNGQPISIEFDATGLNVFRIQLVIVETILEDGAKTVFNPNENSLQISNKATELNASSFENAINSFEVSDVNLMQSNVSEIYNASINGITDQSAFNEYVNLFSTAQTKIDNALSMANFGIAFVQDFINYPAQFTLSVKTRLSILVNQCAVLSKGLPNFKTFNEKKIFENNKGQVINAVINAITTPLANDYTSAVDVYYVIGQSIAVYNLFIEELQGLQDVNGYEQGAYLPDAAFLESLFYAFNYAISNLFAIALTAQQQRSIILEEDSNLIVLAHRFYGLSEDDSTIQKFKQTNNIGLSETYQIKKGRKIIYFV